MHDTSDLMSRQSPGKCPPEDLVTRRSDGKYNDLDYPEMGAAGERFGRNVPLEYTYPEPEPGLLEPSPREVSRRLLARETFIPARSLNLLAAAWIQFQTHDWFSHGEVQRDKTFKIKLAPDDPLVTSSGSEYYGNSSHGSGSAPRFRQLASADLHQYGFTLVGRLGHLRKPQDDNG